MASKHSHGGFALIELLLVAVLLLLFTSAAVVNLAPVWQGARLEEGVGQLESLLRFARAEAAQQGRRLQLCVQILRGPEEAGLAASNRTAIQVRWEPQPLDQPGHFVESRSTAALARSVAEHLRIEQVRRVEASVAAPEAAGQDESGEGSVPGEVAGAAASGAEEGAGWPAIMFYPDGSSDSAEILVGSADAADARLMVVKWNGMSGSAAREELDEEGLARYGVGASEVQPLEPASVARTGLGPSAP